MSDLLGLFGGTFDPVHYGHLRTALEASMALDCDEMRLIPANVPPHRGVPRADPAQRLAMLKLALEGQNHLTLDHRELEREGPSYTVDTLAELRGELPRRPLALVMGEDAFVGLTRWYQWERLIDLAHLVVLTRPVAVRVEDSALKALLAERSVEKASALTAAPAGRILSLTVTSLGISATRIRRLIAAGHDTRYLLPQTVLDYIHRHRLYRGVAGD